MTDFTHTLTEAEREALVRAGCEVEQSFACEGWEVSQGGVLLNREELEVVMPNVATGATEAPERKASVAGVVVDLCARTGVGIEAAAPDAEPDEPETPMAAKARRLEEAAEATASIKDVSFVEVDFGDMKQRMLAAGFTEEGAALMLESYLGALEKQCKLDPDDVAEARRRIFAGIKTLGEEPDSRETRLGGEIEAHLVTATDVLRVECAKILRIQCDFRVVHDTNPNVDLSRYLDEFDEHHKSLVRALDAASTALNLMRLQS